MAGKKGRSGGHNKLSLVERKARGTFRPARHRHLLASTQGNLARQPAAVAAWQPDPAVLKALGPEARGFVQRSVDSYELSENDGLLLLMAARSLDRCQALQAELDAAGVSVQGTDMHPLVRPLHAETRVHLLLLSRLEFER